MKEYECYICQDYNKTITKLQQNKVKHAFQVCHDYSYVVTNNIYVCGMNDISTHLIGISQKAVACNIITEHTTIRKYTKEKNRKRVCTQCVHTSTDDKEINQKKWTTT